MSTFRQVDDVLGRLATLRMTELALLERKEQAIRAWAEERREQGVSRRGLAEDLHAQLKAAGWSAEKIALVGVSSGSLQRLL